VYAELHLILNQEQLFEKTHIGMKLNGCTKINAEITVFGHLMTCIFTPLMVGLPVCIKNFSTTYTIYYYSAATSETQLFDIGTREVCKYALAKNLYLYLFPRHVCE